MPHKISASVTPRTDRGPVAPLSAVAGSGLRATDDSLCVSAFTLRLQADASAPNVAAMRTSARLVERGGGHSRCSTRQHAPSERLGFGVTKLAMYVYYVVNVKARRFVVIAAMRNRSRLVWLQ